MMVPKRFLYLVDIETEEVLSVFSLDDLTREIDVTAREGERRARHGVDDPNSGLVLRDSRLRPIPVDAAREAMRRMKRYDAD